MADWLLKSRLSILKYVAISLIFGSSINYLKGSLIGIGIGTIEVKGE